MDGRDQGSRNKFNASVELCRGRVNYKFGSINPGGDGACTWEAPLAYIKPTEVEP